MVSTHWLPTQRSSVCIADKEWSVRRKLLNPSFHYKVLHKFIPIFNKHVRVLTEVLTHLKGENDIMVPMKKCSMDMICGTCVLQ